MSYLIKGAFCRENSDYSGHDSGLKKYKITKLLIKNAISLIFINLKNLLKRTHFFLFRINCMLFILPLNTISWSFKKQNGVPKDHGIPSIPCFPIMD